MDTADQFLIPRALFCLREENLAITRWLSLIENNSEYSNCFRIKYSGFLSIKQF